MGTIDDCLLDTGCLAAMVAGIAGGIAAAKRMHNADLWGGEGFYRWLLIGLRKTIGAGTINGAVAAALCLLAVEVLGTTPRAAAAATTLLAVLVDFATADGRAILWTIWRAMLRAGGIRIDPPGSGPPADGPPSPPAA